MHVILCITRPKEISDFNFDLENKMKRNDDKEHLITIFLFKFLFSKKATKFDQIFTVDLTLCSKCQIDSENFINFHGLLVKHESEKIWQHLFTNFKF